MRKYAWIILLLILACGKKSSEFKSISKNIKYKYVQLGDGEKINPSEVLEMSLLAKSLDGDTLHYVPDYPYFYGLAKRELDSAFLQFGIGDSISFRMPRKEVNQYFKFYKLMQEDTGYVDLNIRLRAKHNDKSQAVAKQKLLSAREISEQAALRKYLKYSGKDFHEFNGIYRKIYGEAKGDSIQFGDQVSIHYKGSFLNGYVFDNTHNKGITPTFTYGQEYQLLEGIQFGLSGLREGESVKIILPSRRAFGEEGSLAGIVPPYTAVIFDINIIKVNN